MPLDLSLQSPSAFLEEHPRALTSPIRNGLSNKKNRKNRSISPPSASHAYGDNKVNDVPEVSLKHQGDNQEGNHEQGEGSIHENKGPLNVGSWEWDADYRHRTVQSDATSLNKKIQQDTSKLNVLDKLSHQLRETTVTDESHGGVGADGTDDALYIIKNMSSVDDCLKLKQLRREERLKRRAEQQQQQQQGEESAAASIPVPRKDLFTSQFHKEQEEKELEQKRIRKELKAKELKLKEQKIAKANKLAKARAIAAENKLPTSSSPTIASKKVLPSIKPTAPISNPSSDGFKLPEQVMSSKFPVSSKEIMFTLSNPVLPRASSLLDITANSTSKPILLTSVSATFPDVRGSVDSAMFSSSQQLKSKSTSTAKIPTKPTTFATEYVDKQQMWALQVESKKAKARKELEDREMGELRPIPDVKKAQESWVKLKKHETKKAGGEWPQKKEPDSGRDSVGAEGEERVLQRKYTDDVMGEGIRSSRVDPLTSGVVVSHETFVDNSNNERDGNKDVQVDDHTSALDEKVPISSHHDNDTDVKSERIYDTVVKDMTTADNMGDIMRVRIQNDIDYIDEDVIEGEDGFEDDDIDFGGGEMNNTTMNGSTTFSSVADNRTAASEYGYDEQFFSTNSVVKTGASLVLPDGAVIGGFAYEHPLQTNKNDSVYTTPASPLKKVVGDDDVPFDTDRFKDTERSAYDTPKGIFGKENPPTSVRGSGDKWESDEVVATGRSSTVQETGRSSIPQDTARSDCSDYDDEWEFTGLPENNNRTARGSEGTWKRKGTGVR